MVYNNTGISATFAYSATICKICLSCFFPCYRLVECPRVIFHIFSPRSPLLTQGRNLEETAQNISCSNYILASFFELTTHSFTQKTVAYGKNDRFLRITKTRKEPRTDQLSLELLYQFRQIYYSPFALLQLHSHDVDSPLKRAHNNRASLSQEYACFSDTGKLIENLRTREVISPLRIGNLGFWK